MEEARKVLERLSRIRELDGARAPAPALLGELRELVLEAEEWARREGDERAAEVAAMLGEQVARVEEVRLETATVN